DRHLLDHEDSSASRTRRSRASARISRAGIRRPCRLRAGWSALRHPDALPLRGRLSRSPLPARRTIQPYAGASCLRRAALRDGHATRWTGLFARCEISLGQLSLRDVLRAWTLAGGRTEETHD